MADDNYSRSHRAGGPPRWPPRPSGQSSSGNDPLAELARLIGQTDPFSDFAQGRAPQSPQAPREQRQHDPRQHDTRPVPPPLDWASAQEHYRQPPPDPRDTRSRDYYPDDDYADPRHQQGAQGYPGHPAGGGYFDQQSPAAHGYPEAPHGYAREPHPQQDGHDPAYGGDAYYGQMPHDEDMYEQPRPARRGGLVTVMAVLALAVLGTAAAFGYRAVFGTPTAPATPPVIQANTTPTKIVPATKSSDASGKLIYDRVGDPNQPEKVVSREEAPVSNLPNAAPSPRVVLSNGMTQQAPQSAPLQQNAPAFAPQAGAVQPASQSPSPPAASTEPKRIRTVTIRPDQPAGSAPAPESDTTQTARVSADEPPGTPRAPAVQHDQNAPLSLVPSGSAAPRAGAPMRTASAPAHQSQPTAGLQGAYSVQVTSQRTEADAQASYRALQAQFPNVLGRQQAVIRRADLGERGVYYRALVGSFESSEQASQFCRSLRDAGGQCVVQRN